MAVLLPLLPRLLPIMILVLLLTLPLTVMSDTDPSCSYCASSSTWGPGMCSSGGIMLQTTRIKVGIHSEGSFGTSQDAPGDGAQQAECPTNFEDYAGQQLGFIVDYGDDGWNQGSPAYAGDYFVPGSPVEGFVTRWTDGETTVTHDNKGLIYGDDNLSTDSIEIMSDGGGDTGVQSALWIGSSGDIKLSALTEFDGDDLYFTTSITVTNKGTDEITDFYYMRTVDPDQEQPHTGNYVTNNWVEYQRFETGDPDGRASTDFSNLCLVASTGTTYTNLYGGLATINSHCRAGTFGFNNKNPSQPWSDTTWTSYNAASPWVDDKAINLAFYYDSIAAGASKTFKFAYVLSADQVTDALASMDSITIASPSSTATGNVLFQVTLDSTAGGCTTHSTEDECVIKIVKFYIRTADLGSNELLDSVFGTAGSYQYSTFFSASTYIIDDSDTSAQMYVTVEMNDGTVYTQSSVTTLAVQQIQLCWDIDPLDQVEDGLASDYVLEIDAGSAIAFGLALCNSEASATLDDVSQISFFIQITDGSSDAGELLILQDTQAPYETYFEADSEHFNPSPGGSVEGIITAQILTSDSGTTFTTVNHLQFVTYHAPTKAPTLAPTKNPTPAPTKNPTLSPTQFPTTLSPTAQPTTSPTPSPTKNPTKSPTPSPTKNPTPSPTLPTTPNPTASPTHLWERQMEATTTCGCDDCSFYIISDDCPTPAPTSAPTECPTSSASDYIAIIGGVAGGSIILGLILGSCIKSCLSPKKGDKVQPVLGEDTVSIHDDEFATGSKEDGIRHADSTTAKQKEKMKQIANAMTPTRRLSGVVRMRRVVREKLLSLQGHEKEKLMVKLQKLQKNTEEDLKRQEETELDALQNLDHDPEEHAHLVKLRRQDISYLRIRCLDHSRLVREQLHDEQRAGQFSNLANLLDWFVDNSNPMDQNVISEKMKATYEQDASARKLLADRINAQMEEEVTAMKARHEAKWNITPDEEIAAFKKLDMNYQHVVKQDLNDNDRIRRQHLADSLSAQKRIMEANFKLKNAPENEVQGASKNFERFSRCTTDYLEKQIRSTRRRFQAVEEIMCKERGNVNDEDVLRALARRELTALKVQLLNKMERQKTDLKRDITNKKFVKRIEHGESGELEGEIRELGDLCKAQESAIDSHFNGDWENAEGQEKARHTTLYATKVIFWEELVTLKGKHDNDFLELYDELTNAKLQDRQKLAQNMRNKSKTLKVQLSTVESTSATPGSKMARKSTLTNIIEGHNNEKDRLYNSLEMTHKADMDRATAAEFVRQYNAEGFEEDFEARLANMKKAHEKEIMLLSDSLYAEQRRQRDRLKSRLQARKDRRHGEMKDQGKSDAEIEGEMQVLDAEYSQDEMKLLHLTGADIEARIKALRDHNEEEERKADDFNSMLSSIKDQHERNLNEMKRNLESDQRRKKELLKQRLKARRAKRESEANGSSESAQQMLKKEEEEALNDLEHENEREMKKLVSEENARFNGEVNVTRMEIKASDDFFLSLHDDIDRIRNEHSENIAHLEADIDLKNARARKKLKDRLAKKKALKIAELNNMKSGEDEKKGEMGALEAEMRVQEDELERMMLDEELSRKDELSKSYLEERNGKIKSAQQISEMQKDQAEEARKMREAALESQKTLEAEMKKLRAEKEMKLKERLAAKRKKKEASLRKKKASKEDIAKGEAEMLEEELAEKDKLEQALTEERRRLELKNKEEENERLRLLRENEEAAALNAEKEAELAQQRALMEMDKMKKDFGLNAKKRSVELEEERNKKKAKLKKKLEKRRKDREKELEKNKASEEEKEKTLKALQEEEERLKVELEAKLEQERREAEEEARLERAKQDEELHRLKQEAINEAAAAVARKKILQAANDARIQAEKDAAEQQQEEDARQAEEETKRLLDKFQKDQEKANREKNDEKERQRVLLKKRIKLQKEQAARRREAKKKLKINNKESLSKLNDVHKQQLDDLGSHLQKEVGAAESAGGVGISNEEIAAMKEELAVLKANIEEKDQELEDSHDKLEEALGEMNILKGELEHKGEEAKAEKDKMGNDLIGVRKQLEDCARELQTVKSASESQDVVPASDFKALQEEMVKAIKEAGEAQARLVESVKTREDLDHENEGFEAHIKELVGLVGELQGRIDGLAEEHGLALEFKDEERVAAVESAAADLTRIIKELKAEKAEIQVVAERVEKAEELSRVNQEKRDFYEDQYKEVLAQKKKLHNKLEDMKGKVRVYARIRPPSGKEVEAGDAVKCEYEDEVTLSLSTIFGGTEETKKNFQYDSVFGPGSSQEHIFDECSGMIESALDGYSACVFAYGQTGAGKTWTMSGKDDVKSNWGLTRRFVEYLFNEVETKRAKNQATIKVSCEFLEIYCDELRDLFYTMDHSGDKKALANAPKLEPGMNAQGRVVVKGIMCKEASNMEQMLGWFNEGNKGRVVHATEMNKESSRSHSVFTIYTENFNHTTKKTFKGKLNIIDLAGSERTGKSMVEGQQLEEANAINNSLMALGMVVSSLGEVDKNGKPKFVNYRNNILTRVMQDSLGGTSKTLMFVNMSPAESNAQETRGSLEYAKNMKKIQNTVKKDEDSAVVSLLKNEIKELKKELGKY
ncbi:hypothetical protein TrLO_g12317 [Triparma laevis f. longispina]|uniref:Kinesin motor domain-containing protein n=1 Tax=Triparma laevis f. longispina TaxID=1714387 RepID=A0A9W7KXA1_9STRA|nr:hypothetical protein TrLO_g12317 [Triparma laevis f. longispina]